MEATHPVNDTGAWAERSQRAERQRLASDAMQGLLASGRDVNDDRMTMEVYVDAMHPLAPGHEVVRIIESRVRVDPATLRDHKTVLARVYSETIEQTIARMAVQQADALLAELEKPKP